MSGVNYSNSRGDGIVTADGFAIPGLSATSPVYSIIDTVTLAQLNAGKQIIPDIPGKTIKVVGYLMKFNGAFTTATAIVLQDTNSSPVNVVSIAIAGATNGAKISSFATESNTTDGAGLYANLTEGKGLRIAKTGSNAAGGTSITVEVLFTIS